MSSGFWSTAWAPWATASSVNGCTSKPVTRTTRGGRPQRAHFPEPLDAALSRQLHVQEGEVVVAEAEFFHRALPGKGDIDLVAVQMEGLGQTLGEIAIVVDHEDAQATHGAAPFRRPASRDSPIFARPCLARWPKIGTVPGVRFGGQPEGEGGSAAGLALDFDAASVAGDDLFDDGEPQPDAEAFRAIQGLEDFFQLFGGNAAAGIGRRGRRRVRPRRRWRRSAARSSRSWPGRRY